MSNEQVLTVIQETEILSKKIKMYGSIESPWFVAGDVAEWLGERDGYTVARKVDEEYKDTQLVCTPGGNQKSIVLNEDGLYDACMYSKKEIAKPLKKAIKKYLKQIRTTGGAVETGRESEFIDRYFPSFNEDTKLSMVKDLLNQNQKYKEQIEQLEPQAKAYVDLMTAQGYLQFIDVAAMVEIGRNKLFEFLRRCKVLTKQSNFNIPYGKFINNGMFKVITSKSENGHVSSVTMVSPKGLNYIYNLMQKKNVLDKFDATTLLSKIQELEVA
ncbi:Phage antirepressor protein YoqD, KilAC domain [Lacrimispora sphenoides]|uniref:phage antirepressor n=1 Tax=Lacrimispora sphenoides TaxID=29370 RepID=UPI0008C08B6D|nr:phage antirepressor KilAC domain-containing protein [Lacrimispora sphenoides]SEU08167.1 Phage antirepressor protein YoqD, KilAC domain [Lacrimispora sphenoides]